MKSFFLPILLCCLALPLAAGCSLPFSASDDEEEPEDARIIFGRSIEGLEVRDDSSKVRHLLGQPTYTTTGDFDGEVRVYEEGRLEKTEVCILFGNPPSIFSGVCAVKVLAPYDGKTADGVGIGTVRTEALEKLGPPDSSKEGNVTIKDTYLFGEVGFEIIYRDQVLYSILMFAS